MVVSADNASRTSAALIESILKAYHEPHRKDLTVLLRLSERLGESRLIDAVSELSELLENHMFKEEMRAFPMIEQGSSALLGELAEDMMREHLIISEKVGKLRELVSNLNPERETKVFGEFQSRLNQFLAQLEEHASVEDEKLFGPALSMRNEGLIG